jgi:hypothetical protein
MIISLALFGVLIGPLVKAQEDADLAREAKLHQIYKTINEAPTPDDEWKKVLSLGNTQTYTIQEGDTLWGVSEILFGDPHFYPKIWSLNSQSILNPHEIVPEQVVHFTEGTIGEPPSLTIKARLDTPQTEAPAVSAAEPESTLADTVEEADLPPSAVTVAPYRPIPESFPHWDPDPSSVTPFIMDIKPFIISPVGAEVYLETYLQEGSVEGEGVVAETEGGFRASGEEDYIYVKMTGTPSRERFLIVKKGAEIVDPKSGTEATQVLIQAEIGLVGMVNADQNLYRAKVLRLLNQIDVGSHLVVGEIPLMSTKEESPPVAIPADIIGGAYSADRKIFGNDEIVFLNTGSEKGILSGQILPIYKTHSLRVPESEAVHNPRLIGRLKILKATSKFSAAVITTVTEEIRVGDRTSAE